MRNFKITAVVLAVLAALGFSSCMGGTDEESTATYTFADNFEYVTDAGGNYLNGYNNVVYDVELGSDGTVTVKINGLKQPDNIAYGTITLTGLKYSIAKEGWIDISDDHVVGTVAGADVKLTFTQFAMRMVPAPSTERALGFFARFVLDGKYSIFTAPRMQTLYGTMTSAYSGGTYETTATDYIFTFDAAASTVDIQLKNCSFVEQMRKMDITFEDVPFTVSSNKADFSASEIIPVSGGTPYPNFAIRDLAGVFAFAGDMKMDFRCTPPTMPFAFNVSVDCKFDFVKSE